MTTATLEATPPLESVPEQRFYGPAEAAQWLEQKMEADGKTGSRVTLARYDGRDDLWTADVRFRKNRRVFGAAVPYCYTDVVLRIYIEGNDGADDGDYNIHRLRTVYYADGTLLPRAHEHEDVLANCGGDVFNLLSHFIALRLLLESQGYKPLRQAATGK